MQQARKLKGKRPATIKKRPGGGAVTDVHETIETLFNPKQTWSIPDILQKDLRGQFELYPYIFHRCLSRTQTFARRVVKQEGVNPETCILKCMLDRGSIDDVNFCIFLECLDNRYKGDTPLILAAREMNLVALEAILQRIAGTKDLALKGRLGKALNQVNQYNQTCFTILMEQYPELIKKQVQQSRDVLSKLLELFSEIKLELPAARFNVYTPLHILFDNLTHADFPIRKIAGLCAVACRIIDICPTMLERTWSPERKVDQPPSGSPLSPFMHLQSILGESSNSIYFKSLKEHMVYTCVKQGYSMDVLYPAGKELTASLDLSGYKNCELSYDNLNLFRGSGLQSTLGFVRIPPGLSIIPDSHFSECKHDDATKKQVNTIFQVYKWLCDNDPMVTRIVCLEVDGLEAEPCTCVERLKEGFQFQFKVEICNFYKTDVSSSTLRVIEASKPATPQTLPNNNPTKYHFLEVMHTWAEIMSALLKLTDGVKKIRVAVIDDGFDLTLAKLSDINYAGGISFRKSGLKHLQGSMSSIFVSGSTHGTQMVGAIYDLCCDVEFILIRLDEIRPRVFTIRSAGEAINWASSLDPPVDIISMSWTIECGEQATEFLHSAVRTAIQKNIILLCAAPQASNDRQIYPGSFDRSFRPGYEEILTIDAAGSEKSRKDNARVDFIFPGHEVENPIPGFDKPVSGSSIATAIAAGFAANLLFLQNIVEAHDADTRKYNNAGHQPPGATARLANAFRYMHGDKNWVPEPSLQGPMLFSVDKTALARRYMDEPHLFIWDVRMFLMRLHLIG